MKKKLSYRDKLLELAKIYDVKEIKDYVKSKKSLTTGQIELILRKNKIIIPKDYKSNFIRDNFIKPYTKAKSDLAEFKEETIKDKNRLVRKVRNFREDTERRLNYTVKSFWRTLGTAGINFLNILPKLGKTIYSFLGNSFTDVFNGIYNQQLDPKKAKNVIVGIVAVVVIAAGLAFAACASRCWRRCSAVSCSMPGSSISADPLPALKHLMLARLK